MADESDGIALPHFDDGASADSASAAGDAPPLGFILSLASKFILAITGPLSTILDQAKR
jgi:hypothetical protein